MTGSHTAGASEERGPGEHRPEGGTSPPLPWTRLAALVAAAVAVRGVFLWLRGPFLEWDESMYVLLARNLARGDGYVLNGQPHIALAPLVPWLTAQLSRLPVLGLVGSQRTLHAVLGGATLVPVWYLVRLHVGSRGAWAAAGLLVAWPALVDVVPRLGDVWYHMYAGTEPTYLLFLFASLAATERALRTRGLRTATWGLAGGALLALAYLTRTEAVVFGGLYVVLRIGASLRPVRRWAAPGAVGLAAFVAVASPFLLHVHRTTGHWMLSGQPPVMRPTAEILQEAFLNDRRMDPLIRVWYHLDPTHTRLLSPYWEPRSNEAFRAQARDFAEAAAADTPVDRSPGGRALKRLGLLGRMLGTLAGWLFAPLALLGLVTGRRRAFPPFALTGIAAALVVGLHLLVIPRFFLYLVPAVALWTALGLQWAADRTDGAPRWERRAVLALVVTSVGVVAWRGLQPEPEHLLTRTALEREVAREIAPALPPGAPVMHWHPRQAVYGGWPWRALPNGTPGEVAHYAAAKKIRHLYLVEGGLRPFRVPPPFAMATLDPGLAARLRGMAGPHGHDAMVLRPGEPVAGYPGYVLTRP